MIVTCDLLQLEQKQLLANLFELYVYECSSYAPEGMLELNETGLYLFPKLDSYMDEPQYEPYLIRVDGATAGFVIVRKLDERVTPSFRMEQFFIMKKFSGQGTGRVVARQMFDRYRGKWQVEQIERNYPAQAFWRKVIKEYTGDNFVENYHEHKSVQQFSSADPFTLTVDKHTGLKLSEVSDAEALFILIDSSRDYLRQWLPWLDDNRSADDIKKFIRENIAQFLRNDGFTTSIWYKGEVAGCIGFHKIDWPHKRTSIGYWLGERFQNKGIMTASCRTLIEYSFSELQLNRVEIRVAPDNEKSQGIPRRLGFTYEGCIREAEWLYDHYVDHNVYGILQREWT